MRRKTWKKGIALALTASLLMTTACGNNVDKEDTEVETSKKKTDKDKDAKNDKGIKKNVSVLNNKLNAAYIGEKMVIKREDNIVVQLGFDAEDVYLDLDDDIEIYQDANLEHKIDVFTDYDADEKQFILETPSVGIAELYGDDEFEEEYSKIKDESYASGSQTYSWGNLPQYYLVNKIDLETGEELDTPEITVVQIDTEIASAPSPVFSQTEEGNARIYWKEVEDADKYYVVGIQRTEEWGLETFATIIGATDGTEWICEPYKGDDGEVYCMNEDFMEASKKWSDDREYYYGVIAVNEEGASSLSNLVELSSLSSSLPIWMDYDIQNEEDLSNGGFDSFDKLPTTVGVEMCDGSTSQRVIIYDCDNYYFDEFGFINIPARINGTLFTDEVWLKTYDPNTLERDLADLKARQEALIKKGGATIDPSIDITDEEIEVPDDESKDESEDDPADTSDKKNNNKGKTEFEVYGNNELSIYIAEQMLKTEEYIDISDFAEYVDVEFVADAFQEAKYQNPLILGIQDVGYSDQGILKVEYDFDKETTAEKQKEVVDKVDEVISEIITDDMSDFEKEIAINNYLCENAEYDMAALENGKEHDYYYVDEEFYDSFTAYGILVDGVGVCASYAADFKLLCDAAGLECVVVSGNLEGSLPHAWNKVKIDGKWCIVDVTNNDADGFSNGLLNLSDDVSSGVLVQKDDFVLDTLVDDFEAETDELEYYHVMDKFFEKDQIVQKLVEDLNANNKTTLRTDYSLSDDELMEILNEVASSITGDFKYGSYFGMIHLEY